MSVLLCDSNGELWFTRANELKMNYFKMPYSIDKEYLYDLGETVDICDFYRQVRAGQKPTTSALSPQNYIDIIEPIFADGHDILYVSFSHKLSGTFGHLETALKQLAESYPERKLQVFNTNSISLGAGMQMERAQMMFNNGATTDEIIEFLNDFTNHVAVYFMVSDLMHLKRGGRISPLAATFGTMLDVKPILSLNAEGGLDVYQKVNGKRKALKFLAARIIEEALDGEDNVVYIVDGDNQTDGDFVRDLVLASRPNLNIVRQIVGPVIGTHCGPNTIGVIFVANARPIPLK